MPLYNAPLDIIRFLAMAKPWVCLVQDKDGGGQLPLDHAKSWNRDDDIIEFLTAVTKAAASVSTDKLLKSKTVLPPETFIHVATFVYGLPEEAAIVKLALSADELYVLLQRHDIRTTMRAQAGCDQQGRTIVAVAVAAAATAEQCYWLLR